VRWWSVCVPGIDGGEAVRFVVEIIFEARVDGVNGAVVERFGGGD